MNFRQSLASERHDTNYNGGYREGTLIFKVLFALLKFGKFCEFLFSNLCVFFPDNFSISAGKKICGLAKFLVLSPILSSVLPVFVGKKNEFKLWIIYNERLSLAE